MSKYTITMSNGVVLDNLAMNGSMYVSQDEVTMDMFGADALSEVTIVETDEAGTRTVVHHNMICDNVLHWPEGWLFNLREMSESEQERMNLEARLEEQEAALIELAAMIGGAM